jgi:hypothetical protein
MTDDTLRVLGERAHIALNQMVAMSKRIKVKQTMTHKIMFPITILRQTMKYCLSEVCVCAYVFPILFQKLIP